MIEIKKPIQTTYFITWSEGAFSYGEVLPEQEMTSGLINLWTTFDKQEFVDKLLEDYSTVYEEIIP
jgi:hypothetical protein